MKTVLYIKTVLTIIAICLVIIVFKNINFIPEANAEGKNNSNNLSSNKEVIDVNIRSIGGNVGLIKRGVIPVAIFSYKDDYGEILLNAIPVPIPVNIRHNFDIR